MTPQMGREKDGIFLHHCVFVPKVASKEDRAHEASEKDHCCPWNMFGVEEGKLYIDLLLNNCYGVSLIIVIGVHIL